MTALRILICSGNLGNCQPDVESIKALIPPDGSFSEVVQNPKYPIRQNSVPVVAQTSDNHANGNFDLIVLGLQESIFELDLEQAPVRVVTKTLNQGATTIHGLTATRNHTHPTTGITLVETGTAVLHQRLQDRLPSYHRLLSFQRGEMRLLIYTHPNASPNIRLQSVRAQNTGLAGLANKGGIVAELVVHETTVVTFVSCHLEAHEGLDKYKTRLDSINAILKGTKQFAIPPIYPDVSLASHFCFFLGDMNFRTRLHGRITSEEQRHDVMTLIQNQDWDQLYAADELHKALQHHECLHGFQTLDCNFPPTFKLIRGPGYHYKDNRTPSYTDRILWKTGPGLNDRLTPLTYEPIDQFASSDHKPVRAAFQVSPNQALQIYPRPLCLRSSVLEFMHLSRTSTTPASEHLHLYLSDSSMDIFPIGGDRKTARPPDTYLALVTSPQALLLKPTTLWEQCVQVVRVLFCCHQEFRQLPSWPRTTVITDSFNPNWGQDQEVHCRLRGYGEDGARLQLGGAILHLLAFQFHGHRQVDEVLGSYPINLEYLYRCCLQADFQFDHPEPGITVHRTAANPKMVSLHVNAPLLKNGLQTGVIRCTLDAWWVQDELAHAAGAHHLRHGLASNDDDPPPLRNL